MRESKYSELGKRECQQDCVATLEIDGVMVLGVCDGNGGLGGGELANIALKSTFCDLSWQMAQDKGRDASSLRKFALAAINTSGNDVKCAKEIHDDWSEAGTTITLVLISRGYIISAWVGDSPAYMMNNQIGLKRLVVPHNLLEEYVREGWSRQSLEGQEALNSTLTRCLGYPDCEPDSMVESYSMVTKVVAGSDGVLDYLTEEEILNVFSEFDLLSWNESSQRFVEKALDNASDDNVSAVTAICFPKRRLTQVRTRFYKE